MGRKPSQGTVRYWRDPDLPQVEIRFSSYQAPIFREHTHETYSVALILEGETSFVRAEGEHPVHAGQVALIEPHVVHACNPDMTRAAYRMYYVDADWLEGLGAELAGRPPAPAVFPSPVVDDPELFAAWERVFFAIEQDAPRMVKQSRLVAAGALLLGEHARLLTEEENGEAEREAVALAREYLEQRLADKIPLAELAGRTGLSPAHLMRVFREATGFTPHGYQMQRRVDRAKTLLLDGLSIAQAATDCGFVDQSHFTRKFKELTGSTPAQYQNG